MDYSQGNQLTLRGRKGVDSRSKPEGNICDRGAGALAQLSIAYLQAKEEHALAKDVLL